MAGNCLREHSDSCVIYQGPDIQCVGLVNGMGYDAVTVQLAETLCEHIEKKVELKCLYDDSCSDYEVSIPEAVEKIIAKLCTLTAEDIAYNGDLFCIGGDSISAEAVRLLGRSVRYTTEPTASGLAFSYDLAETVRNLPSGYALASIRVKGIGRNSAGTTTVFDTSRTAAGIKINNATFPLDVSFTVVVSSPNGSVELSRSINIPSASRKTASVQMQVRDFASSPTGVTTVQDVTELMLAQVCENTSELDQLRVVEITGCDDIQYPSNDIKDVVSVQSGELCDIKGRLDNIGAEKIEVADCEGNTSQKTISSAINDISSLNCSLLQSVIEIESQLQVLERRVDECCIKSTGSSGGLIGGGGSISGASGGSVIVGGGCSGGNCPA